MQAQFTLLLDYFLDQQPKHPKVIQSPKFNLFCHHCGVFNHTRPYYYKLNMVSSFHAYNQPRNQYERLENQIIVLTMCMNRFISKPRQFSQIMVKRGTTMPRQDLGLHSPLMSLLTNLRYLLCRWENLIWNLWEPLRNV